MSRGVNVVIIVGNLVADPETAFTTSGLQVSKFRVAVNTKKGTNERTIFRNAVCFGALAEIVDKYLKKGSKVYLSGEANDSNWEDKDGNKRFSTEVVVEQMNMLDSKDNSYKESTAPAASKEETPLAPPPMDDIPF